MRNRSHAVAVIGLLIHAAVVCTAQDLSPVATFPLIVHDDFIGTYVEHRGKQYLFELHSASDRNICDSSFERYFGPPLGVATVGDSSDSFEVKVFRDADLRVGGTLWVEPAGVVCTDLARRRWQVGEDLRGVLGSGFFRGRAIQIDFDERQLRLFRTGMSSEKWGERIRLIEEDNAFYCQAAVAQSDNDWFLVNTAESMVGLERRVFRRVSADGALQDLGQSRLGDWRALSVKSVPYGTLSSFQVGSFSHRDKIHVQERNANCLGLAYLSRYLVTFDVSAGAMYLRPGARFDVPDVTNATGLHLWQPEQPEADIVVWSVDEQSPAARAGVRKDDVLLRIDGRAAPELRLSGVRRLLRDIGGSTLTLELRRGDRTFTAPLSVK